MSMTVGFVGLGLMGQPMVRRLLSGGVTVQVWNRTPAKTRALVADGAKPADSPAAIAGACGIVICCVTDATAMEAVVFGQDGLATADGAGKVLLDHSSIHPDATRAMAARLLDVNGMAWIDAPVSGGVAGAEAGTLAIMAGGNADAFAKAEPIMAHYAARATLMGGSGAGQTAKLCNQMIVGCNLAVIAEALRFATNAGIEADRLFGALEGGFADSKPFQIFGPRMLEPGETPFATVDVMLKDVDTALDVGRKAKAPMPMTATAGEIYRLLASHGLGADEYDAIYRHLGGPAKG